MDYQDYYDILGVSSDARVTIDLEEAQAQLSAMMAEKGLRYGAPRKTL